MKKSYFFKFFVFALVGALAILPSCKDYDDDISRLDADLTALKNSALVEANLTALQTQLTSSIAAVQTDLNAEKTKLAALQASAATKAEVDAAKADVLAQAVKLETFNSYKEWVDGEIATLKTDLANAASKEEVEALETLLNSEIASVREELSLTVANLEALTVIVEGNSDAIADVETQLADQLAEIEANATEIAALKADFEEQVEDLTAEIDALKASIATMQEDIDAFEAALEAAEARMDGIDTEIETINSRIDVLKAAIGADLLSVTLNVNSMITEISFDYQGDDVWTRNRNLDFTTTPARVNYTFATGVSNPIVFVSGERQATAGVKITVKVSPANADLTKMVDKIKLIRSDANAQINNYVTVSKVERAKPLLTRATPTVTGLWDITFELPTSANLTQFRNLIQSPAPVKQYLFALAIENTVDEADDAEDRFVISDFAIALSANDITPIYNSQDAPADLTFDARGLTTAAWIKHTALQNRYGFSDPVSATVLTDKAWNTAWSATNVPVADVADNRAGLPLLNVEVGKEFNVRLTNPNIYAYYVTLDKDYAVESIPSEINAWNAYQYEGLNTVYMADEVAKIKINSASAAGDIIGFRVHAVNWDGTLVDPDGKAFYVGVGASATTNLDFVQTITAPMTAGQTLPTNVLNFTSPAGVAIASYDFDMTIGHNVALTNTNLSLLDAADAVTTSWSAVRKLQITGVVPANLEEGVTYTGTLTLKNAAGIPVNVTTVTLRKALPTADLGITYKSNIHHPVNGEQVVYGYPLPGSRLYDVTTALNVPLTMTDLVVTNNSTYLAASLPTWSIATPYGLTAANIPTAEIGVPYLPEAAPGHGKIYDLTLSRNYGPVKYDAASPAGTGVNYNLNWTGTPALKVEFRSFIQDLYDWKFATEGTVLQTPTLVYGETPATPYALTNITALPPAGPRINMDNTVSSLQDGRSFTVAAVELLTGANFDVVNEYFTPTLDATSTSISFTPVTTSTPAGPVPTKLRLTLTDDFGHNYEFVVPQSFNMTLN